MVCFGLLMKAHAYAETYSRTAYSSEPVTYYVLRFGFSLGVNSIRTPDFSDFEKLVMREEKKGIRVVKSSLPLLMRSKSKEVIDVDVAKPIEAVVERVPFDKVA